MRTQFNIKLQEDTHKKLVDESKKLWLTMSAFISMLIHTYKSVTINKEK